ncbi:Maternal effect protein staufen, partial [Trichostrongylus colubriformis]
MVGFSPCVKENLYASSRAEDDPKVAVSSINTAQADTACVSSRAIHPQPWCGQHQASSDISSRNVYNYSNQEEKEKTPMCRIAELARFHKLKHEYKLMDESGPAHKKMFTVQLFLTAEE